MKTNQKGETIVEIMLSLAVLGAVVGASYAITSKSLAVATASQERSNATRLAETQIEYLKYLAENFPASLNAIKGRASGSSGVCLSLNADGSVTDTLYNGHDNCKDSSNLYTQVVTYRNDFGGYQIQLTWPSMTVSSNNVTIRYKVGL
jgi:hypothetical protein